MRYHSTRGGQETGLVDAVMRGLAADGGLFVPDELPRFDPAAVRRRVAGRNRGRGVGAVFRRLRPRGRARRDLPRCVRFPVAAEAVDCRARRARRCSSSSTARPRRSRTSARGSSPRSWSARCARSTDSRPLTILVATSGDTGGAVAAAFHRRRGIRVGVLFPKGQVSPRQQHQLTCWGDNIRAFEVDGAVRRLPGAAEGRVHGLRPAAAPSAHGREQHQHRPLAAAGGLSRGRRAFGTGDGTARRRARSSRAAISATAWRASGRARWACRCARSCLP